MEIDPISDLLHPTVIEALPPEEEPREIDEEPASPPPPETIREEGKAVDLSA